MMLFGPIILPFTAIVLILLLHRRGLMQRVVTIVALSGVLLQAAMILREVILYGPMAAQAGGWSAPFGITFYADLFTAILLVTTAVIALLVSVYAIGMVDMTRLKAGYGLLSLALVGGVNGAFLTGDIFNLYVWFEVMLIASFVLITLGGETAQLRGAVKYVVLNLVGSLLFVVAIGLIYGQTGTLNMADLAVILRKGEPSALVNSALMLFFVAFGIKAALFPFYFWLPASYPTPPVAVTALFAGTLTKVGVYSIIRFYSLFVVSDLLLWKIVALTVAGTTMVSGVLMAASSFHIRKILSFHIISQIGYMLMGVGLTSVLGLAGAIYFIVHNMLSKTAAFLAGGLISRFRGSEDLANLGGVYRQRPLLAFLFLIPAFSLAGIPPTPGFFGKLMLIVAGFRAQEWGITAVAIAVGLITLFSMVKIWNEAAWKREPEGTLPLAGHPVPMVSLVTTAIMAVLIIAFGIATGPIGSLFTDAASQLFDVSGYIQTVLNPKPL